MDGKRLLSINGLKTEFWKLDGPAFRCRRLSLSPCVLMPVNANPVNYLA